MQLRQYPLRRAARIIQSPNALPNRRPIGRRDIILCAVLSPLLANCAPEIDVAPLGVRQTSPRQPIPESFRTYTLFLNTSSDVAAEYRTATDTLAEHFKTFGDSIGERNLAVWIYDGTSHAPDTLQAKTWLDVFNAWSGRSLEYTDGPFVAIMNRHPTFFQGQIATSTEPAERPKIVVIGFRGLDASSTVGLLEYLERRIRTESVRPTEIEIESLHRQFLAWLSQNRDVIIALLSKFV